MNWYKKSSILNDVGEKLFKVISPDEESEPMTIRKAIDFLQKVISEGIEAKIVPAGKKEKTASVQEDSFLVSKVQEKMSGMAVHDMSGVIQKYYDALDTGEEELVGKHENALRLFLNTGDAKRSKNMVEGLISKWHNDRAMEVLNKKNELV